MKQSLVFEQDSAGPRPPGRPPREAKSDPNARARVVAHMSEAQRAQLFAFAEEQRTNASDIIVLALQAMGVIGK